MIVAFLLLIIAVQIILLIYEYFSINQYKRNQNISNENLVSAIELLFNANVGARLILHVNKYQDVFKLEKKQDDAEWFIEIIPKRITNNEVFSKHLKEIENYSSHENRIFVKDTAERLSSLFVKLNTSIGGKNNTIAIGYSKTKTIHGLDYYLKVNGD